MTKYFATLLSALLASTSSFADSIESFSLFDVNPGQWMEISIPFTENDGFDAAIDREVTQSNGGLSLTYGWQQDHWGFTIDATALRGPSYDGTLEVAYPISQTDIDRNICFNGPQHGNRCRPCAGSDSGYCVVDYIQARDRYTKYSSSSLAIGFYVPLKLGRILMQAGPNLRLHNISEDINSIKSNDSHETSVTASVKFMYEFKKNWSLSTTYEQSVSGFKYKSWKAGLVYRR